MTRARQNRNVRIIVPRSGLYVAYACAEPNVKNVCNVSNRVLLLKIEGRKAKFGERLPHILITFFKVLQSFHPLRLSFQKFGQKKGF